MSDGRLVIGTRRYSSWSMRGWLAVRLARLDVDEVVIPLDPGGATAAVKQVSPNGLVPYLEHRGDRVWESLAIVEYCAELEPAIWPGYSSARAHARSISAEMHAGFAELRRAMPMNVGRRFPGRGRTPGALADIARLESVWAEARGRWGERGPFLFGPSFGGADAMFAPVVARLLTYEPEIAPHTRAYCEAVRAHPLVSVWYDAASAEPAEWRLDKYETVP